MRFSIHHPAMWIQDDPAPSYYSWWTAWAGGANNPNQSVPYTDPSQARRRPKRRDHALKHAQNWVGLQKRQDLSSQPSVVPSCLAAIEATARGFTVGATAVPVGGTYGASSASSASSFGTMPTQSAQSGFPPQQRLLDILSADPLHLQLVVEQSILRPPQLHSPQVMQW